MPTMKEGDRVRIVTRPATEQDAKTGLYYTHFGGLVGRVQKVYSKDEVAVDIETDSLTRDIRRRHDDVRDQMKTRWLEGLSEEGRSKLTEREKDFNLRFVLLVSMADLEQMPARSTAEAPPAAAGAAPQAAQRRTLADLDAAEEAELQRRQRQS